MALFATREGVIVSLCLAYCALALVLAFLHCRRPLRLLPQIRGDSQTAFLIGEIRRQQMVWLCCSLLAMVLVLTPLWLYRTPKAVLTVAADNKAAAPVTPAASPTPAPGTPVISAAAAPVVAPVSGESLLEIASIFRDLQEDGAALSPDSLKQYYENALVGAWILKQCGRSDQSEIERLAAHIRRQLITYHQRLGSNSGFDPAALYASIHSAARGSYEMFYHRATCDHVGIDMLEQQFAGYLLQAAK